MKKILAIPLILMMNTSFGQDNLIFNGDFEYYNQNLSLNEGNPTIPCYWGFINDNSNNATSNLEGWYSFGYSSVTAVNSHTHSPDLFDSRITCYNSNGTFNQNLTTTTGCTNNFPTYCSPDLNIGIPDNFYGHQAHRTPIGGNVIGRYIGLKRNNPGNNPGVYVKLQKKLKCGFTYHLRFYAVNKGGSPLGHELEVRFCKGNNWNQDKVKLNGTNNHQINVQVNNTNDWNLVDIPFYVEDPDVEYFMIRLNGFPNRKILLDDFSIMDECAVGKECSLTYGDGIDNVICNNVHNDNVPLTFFNLEPVTDFNLTITALNGSIVRQISIHNPNDIISWDGKNDPYGYTLANGIYFYHVELENDCRCRKFTGAFQKTGDPPLLNLQILVSSNTGALTCANFGTVDDFKMTISTLSGVHIRTIDIPYPTQTTLAWDGSVDAGAPIPVGGDLLYYEITIASGCGILNYNGNFTYHFPINLSDPSFDYSSSPHAPFLCGYPFRFDYREFPRPPVACCPYQPDIYLSNIDLIGYPEYKALHNIDAGPNVTVKPYADVLFQAGNEINLLPGFSVEPGADFLAIIAPCDHIMEPGNNLVTQTLSAQPVQPLMPLITPQKTINFELLPNPTTGLFKINSDYTEKVSVQILDINGSVIQTFSNISIQGYIFNVSTLPKGIYFVGISANESAQVLKLILN